MADFAGIDEVLRVIAGGGVVVIPTDTVYGLACDPADAAAVERVYAIKSRPADLELTALGASIGDFEAVVAFSDQALQLARRYWPGPLSMVAPVRWRTWAIPRSGATLACRVPDHAGVLALLRRCGPLASTSANRHGGPPATTAAAASAQLGKDVDAILDGGPADGLASTIIDCATTPPRVLRAGPIAGDELLSYLRGLESSEGHERRERHKG